EHGTHRTIGFPAVATSTVALRLTKTRAIGVLPLCHGRVGSHDSRNARARNLRYPRDRIAHDGVVHPAQPSSACTDMDGIERHTDKRKCHETLIICCHRSPP